MKEGAERNEELLEGLHDTLARLIHYYNGMMNELAEGRYTAEQAERDMLALTYNEGMEVLPILADMVETDATVSGHARTHP